MSNTILKAENISKQYRLGLVGLGTVRHDLNRFWHLIRGKEDPYLSVGAINDRSGKATQDYVWALRDINFEVKQGEILGIIGKNGAGKSTLLKLLSRVTTPTTGVIKSRGRIASLLEVGTGFHPELTGRENIYLNGAILGMTRSEINAKIDEIIDFSGCEMYIDTPTKRYSSGMTVRLGFAVAAHLEPDILVVDEVLAVGDAEFQKKAIGKMQDISTGEGRTVLFVSHNMGSIKSLCSSCMLMKNGTIDFLGDTDVAVSKYLEVNRQNIGVDLSKRTDRSGSGDAKVNNITYLNDKGNDIASPVSGEPLTIRFHYMAKRDVHKAIMGIAFFNKNGMAVTGINNDEHGHFLELQEGEGYIDLVFDRLHLYAGSYYLTVILSENDSRERLDIIEDATVMEVLPGDFWKAGKNNRKRNTPVIVGTFKSGSYK